MEDRLATHIQEQDRIDETAICIGCGELVYLHDRGDYETRPAGVICNPCMDEVEGAEADAAARDASIMEYEFWQEHWRVVAGEVVPR